MDTCKQCGAEVGGGIVSTDQNGTKAFYCFGHAPQAEPSEVVKGLLTEYEATDWAAIARAFNGLHASTGAECVAVHRVQHTEGAVWLVEFNDGEEGGASPNLAAAVDLALDFHETVKSTPPDPPLRWWQWLRLRLTGWDGRP